MMKKLIYFLIGLILLCSCSSSESMDENFQNRHIGETMITNQEVVNVQLQLDSLNHAMFANSGQTRFSFRKLLKQIGAVVLGDAIGGMFGLVNGGGVGAAIGAATASAAVGIAVFTDAASVTARSGSDVSSSDFLPMNNDSISLSPNIIPERNSLSETDSIGYYHNQFMLTIKEELNIENCDFDHFINEVARLSCENYNISEKEAANILKKNKNIYQDISLTGTLIVESNMDIHEAIEAYKKLYPEHFDKLSLLESFFEGLMQLDINENNGRYLNKVLDIVEISSLNENMKRDLKNAFIVGNASYQLWNVQEN